MGHERSSVRDWKKEAAAWQARAEHLQAAVDRLRSLAVAGESAGFLAHELNNLFTPVVGYCQAASIDGASDELRGKAIKKSLLAAEKVGELSRAILGLAGSVTSDDSDREAGPGGAVCDVRASVRAALLVLGAERWEREGVEIKADVARGTMAAVPAAVVQQVVMNLVLNARRAMVGRRGAIEIAVREAGGVVRVEVRDGGEGMNQEVMGRVLCINNSDDDIHGHQPSAGTETADNRKLKAEIRGGPSEGAGADQQQVDVQELARSGSINGQARWGVRLREMAKGPTSKLPKRKEPEVPAASLAARKKQEGTLARLRGGKLAASASPIRIWDAEEVARELRSAESEKRKAESGNECTERGGAEERGGRGEGVGDGESEKRKAKSGNECTERGGAEERGGRGEGVGEGDQMANGEWQMANRKGTGLGIALCLELVGKFGGRMSARSEVGVGTTVVVELPAAAGVSRRAA